MRPGHKGALALAFVLAFVLVGVAGCGNDAGKEADEGVPIKLGDLEINVQETRFLNPAEPDDNEYLEGQPAADAGRQVLPRHLPHDEEPSRQRGAACRPRSDEPHRYDGRRYRVDSQPHALRGTAWHELAGGADIPVPDTAAAGGPTQGALVLFLVDQAMNENRPLKLEIEHEGETGEITLDI